MKQFFTTILLSLFYFHLFSQPVAVCYNGIEIDHFRPDGTANYWAVDFDAASYQANGDYFELKCNQVLDLNNNGFPDSNEIRQTPPVDGFEIEFDLDEPDLFWVQLWAVDPDGPTDFCLAEVNFTWPEHLAYSWANGSIKTTEGNNFP